MVVPYCLPRCFIFIAYHAILSLFLVLLNVANFLERFLRKAHITEHPSRGCPHLVLITQLSRLMQCG